MLPHVREANITQRIDQITNIFYQICDEHPIKINSSKINQSIGLINLSWVIAIRAKECEFFGKVNFEDRTLMAMQRSFREKIISKLRDYSNQSFWPKYVDEVDPRNTTVTKTADYLIPPELIKLVIADLTLKKTGDNHSSSINDVTQLTCPVEKAVILNILPKLTHDDTFITATKNNQAWQCFEKISEIFIEEKDLIFTLNTKNQTDANIQGKIGETPIKIGFDAFRKRYLKLWILFNKQIQK